MGRFSLGAEPAALAHAEAVLLVGDHQPQIGKNRALGNERMGAHHNLALPGGNALPDLPLFLRRLGARQQGHRNAQRLEQPAKRLVVLLRENLCRSHQGRLGPVSGRAIGGGRRHHGLAAAHVSLDQPVHGAASAEIPQNLLHRPFLRPCEGKGQALIEFLHPKISVCRNLLHGPGGAHQRQARGEYEELLKNQPFPGLLRLGHIHRCMDRPIGLLRRKNAVAFPDFRRQDFCRRIADRQGLAHKLCHGRVGKPRGQGINGHNPAGCHSRRFRQLKNGIGDSVAGKVSGKGAVKHIFPAIFQVLRGEAGIEKGQVQSAGMVRHLHLCQIQPLADVGCSGRGHHHRPEAGRLVHHQVGNAAFPGPVLITPGKMADQVPQGKNIQCLQHFRLGGADPPETAHRIGKPCHDTTFFPDVMNGLDAIGGFT